MSEQIMEQPDVALQEVDIDQEHLVLFNDEVNTFDHVIDCLVDICRHAPEQAEQCATITHYKGKCSIKVGSFEKLSRMHQRLSEKGLSVELN